MSRIFSAALTALLFVLLGVSPAGASGLKTHLWVAQQIIDDLGPDCAVELADREYRIPDETCRAILDNPGSFLAGALGPDAYPDIITGQVTTHPGIEGDWQTSDWLRHLYRSASSPSEVAFAAGYLIHAATDAFAHTYVNGYAGDVFELGDERAVELRHFVLEKYIDAHLPPGEPDPNALDAPSEFLARWGKLFHVSSARPNRDDGTVSIRYTCRTLG